MPCQALRAAVAWRAEGGLRACRHQGWKSHLAHVVSNLFHLVFTETPCETNETDSEMKTAGVGRLLGNAMRG